MLSICLLAHVAKHMWVKLKGNLRFESVNIFKDDEQPFALHFIQHHGGEPRGLKVKGIYSLGS